MLVIYRLKPSHGGGLCIPSAVSVSRIVCFVRPAPFYIFSYFFHQNFFNSFGGWAKVMNGMDFDFIKKLRQAGLTNWSLEIESGSDKVLKLMGKPYTSAKAEEILKNGHELGIRQSFQIIIGFPGETEENCDETISFIKRVSEYIIEVNFCYMSINHYTMRKHFKDYISPQLDINYGTQWSSIDGANTPEVRAKRMERLEGRILKSTDLLKRDPLHYAKSSL